MSKTPTGIKNRLDMPDDMLVYDSAIESPVTFIKSVVKERAIPNAFTTRKQFYGRFIADLSATTRGKIDSPAMYDDVLAAFKRSGAEGVDEMQVFVAIVYVEELQPYPFPESIDSPGAADLIFKIANNGGIFKSFTFLSSGGTIPEYGDNVVVSFADPANRKEGMFEYPLVKGTAAVALGGSSQTPAGTGPTNPSAPQQQYTQTTAVSTSPTYTGGGPAAPSSPFACGANKKTPQKPNTQSDVAKTPQQIKKEERLALRNAKRAERKEASKVKRLGAATAKGKAVQAQYEEAKRKLAAAKAAGDKKAAKKLKKEVRKLAQTYNFAKNIQKASRAKFCPSSFPSLPTEFPLVLDRRNEIKNKVLSGRAGPKGSAYFANYYSRGRRQRASRMQKAIMIILHQTAGGRPRNSVVDGVKVGKKVNNYQTAPGKVVTGRAITTPVHFFLDTFNSYWNYSLEYTSGAGDQELNGGNARVPAIGIEIMNTAQGVVGSPPAGRNKASSTGGNTKRGKGKNKLATQIRVMSDTQDSAFARSGPTGTTLPPSQIEALRQTLKFIISYLQKQYGTRIVYIAQHRSGYSSKPSCPGDYAYRFGAVPVLAEMGLEPLPIKTPFKGALGHLEIVKYGGKGAMLPEAYFHDTGYEEQFKDIGYKYGLPFTRSVGWNARNRVLTLEEAKAQAKSKELRKYRKRKKKK